MKIYFNRRPAQGPWGGGSKILSAIIQECYSRKHELFFEEELSKDNFDIMFCVDPRPNQFVNFGALVNKKSLNPKSKLIQRVGDLGTHGKPELLELVKLTSQFSDFLIFPSEWAKNYLSPSKENFQIIPNAPLVDFIVEKKEKIFTEKLKIVSHHWSDNVSKGFEIYQSLDAFCKVNNDFTFTFVGRKPSNIQLANHVPPLDIPGLIEELPKHDIYVTASKFEAGANHVLEAMALGLPVLYHKDGGSINEYCKDFGMMYKSFEELINLLKNRKNDLLSIQKNISYKRSAKNMAQEYVNLFEALYES